ncbi:MAG: Rieske 2Fe-2S domain-containing protein [Acidimicrobiia bacterium]
MIWHNRPQRWGDRPLTTVTSGGMMQVEFTGHAGISLTAGDTHLLMDAWLSPRGAFDASWFQLPSNHHFFDRDWSSVTGLIVSHEHLDHLDVDFLNTMPPDLPFYIPAYGSMLYRRKVGRLTGRRPVILQLEREHPVGDIGVAVWIEDSPINQDSVWVFTHEGRSIVHTVDSRLTPHQLDQILEYLGGPPDMLLVQCSGASWYPLVYEQYADELKQSRSERKRAQKLGYALSVARRLNPATTIICAGPPVFLDPELQRYNTDPSFPLPSHAKTWFAEQGYIGRVEAPLPGDRIDLATGELIEDAAMHRRFSWDRTAEYLPGYAAEAAPQIAQVYANAEGLAEGDLYPAFEEHFTAMFELSPYFNQRIDMTLRFDIEGDGGGIWLVGIGEDCWVSRGAVDSPFNYRYRFHSRWLKRILFDHVPWEDFFLSLRFLAARKPDVYNDHLLGLLKFNDRGSLREVEKYERRESDETIVVTTPDGTSYEINRYCPHAGASLEGGTIEGHILTCLNHHYEFDLDTGVCLTGDCELRTRRLDEIEPSPAG